MTNPNSASPQPPDLNSAPSLLSLKLMHLAMMSFFWLYVVFTANDLADILYGVPAEANTNSALLYMVSAIILFLGTRSPNFIPDWGPLVAVIAFGASLAHVNSPWFRLAISIVWLVGLINATRGQVFPWSPRVRLCFTPDRVIYELAYREYTEQKTKES